MSALHSNHSYSSLIVAALRRFPDRVAFELPDRVVTYREVERRAAAISARFSRDGIGHGDGVALVSSNRPEVFMVLVATLAVGARFTPLHPLGSIDDHAAVCEDADIAALVVDGDTYGEHGAHLTGRLTGLRARYRVGGGTTADDNPLGTDLAALEGTDIPIPAQADESDIAFVTYTGGTTGRPKGVMLSHRAMTTNLFLTLATWQLPDRPRFLGVTPLSHALGAIVAPILCRGGTVVLHQTFDPAAVLDAVERDRITTMFLVPTMIYVLLDQLLARTRDLSSLRLVVYGAGPMSPARLKQALDQIGPVFMQLYGQTEAPNLISTLRTEEHDPAFEQRLSSCGKPHPGVEVQLRDEQGTAVAQGDIGEICVRGPLVMDGYWKQPELSRQTLRDGWLHTGDMGRFDEDGYLYLIDRKKDVIITGGFNVYPREVEDALGKNSAVRMCAVIGVPDEKWGEAVTALVVRSPEETVPEHELIALVRDTKGPVHAPKRVIFEDALPMTPLGKVDKRALRERFWRGHDRAVN